MNVWLGEGYKLAFVCLLVCNRITTQAYNLVMRAVGTVYQLRHSRNALQYSSVINTSDITCCMYPKGQLLMLSYIYNKDL